LSAANFSTSYVARIGPDVAMARRPRWPHAAPRDSAWEIRRRRLLRDGRNEAGFKLAGGERNSPRPSRVVAHGQGRRGSEGFASAPRDARRRVRANRGMRQRQSPTEKLAEASLRLTNVPEPYRSVRQDHFAGWDRRLGIGRNPGCEPPGAASRTAASRAISASRPECTRQPSLELHRQRLAGGSACPTANG
jgi:hypothetical protein